MLQQQQNLGQRFGTNKMHFSPPVAALSGGSFVVDSLLIVTPIVGFCVLCFVVRYLVSILVLQSSQWGRESWLLCFVCLLGVS